MPQIHHRPTKNTSDRGVMENEKVQNYSYDELVKKPDMKITVIDDTIDYKRNSRKEVVDIALKMLR